MSVPLAVLTYLLVDMYAVCAGSPLGGQFCSIFLAILGGLFGGIILFAIVWELTSLLPGLALPARFGLLGTLRFTNPDYRQKYIHLNPNPEIPVLQRQMPVGVYIAAMAALLFSIVSDLDTMLMGRSSDPGLQIVPVNYLLILMKVGLVAMFWRMKKAAFILWIVVIATEFVANPSFDINDRGEELVVVAALLLIFLYEWWQTRRSIARAATIPPP
ncbi:MAG: hypothetical protein JW862_16760 [Anaerolineales bacterium]|nr:hypothetical protein [Anaerolineales bacterium]